MGSFFYAHKLIVNLVIIVYLYSMKTLNDDIKWANNPKEIAAIYEMVINDIVSLAESTSNDLKLGSKVRTYLQDKDMLYAKKKESMM